MKLQVNFQITPEDVYILRTVSDYIEGLIAEYTQSSSSDEIDDFFNTKKDTSLKILRLSENDIDKFVQDLIDLLEKENIIFQAQKVIVNEETNKEEGIVFFNFNINSTLNQILAEVFTLIDWSETLQNVKLLGIFQNPNNYCN